ncbi:MAG: hypothetical protein J6E43_00195 [Prevotella sp.]|nr:hypothetical protein [Prevotella sp.]
MNTTANHLMADKSSRFATQNTSIAAAAIKSRNTDEAKNSFASVPTLLLYIGPCSLIN